MENTTHVIACLAGNWSPIKRNNQAKDQAADLLNTLLTKTGDERSESVANLLLGLSANHVVSYVSRAMRAVLISDIDAWPHTFHALSSKLQHLASNTNPFTLSTFYQGVILGCAEGIDYLCKNNQVPEEKYTVLFLHFYLEFMLQEKMPSDTRAFGEDISGQLCNVSSSIVTLLHADMFFSVLNKRWISKSAEPFVTEFCLKQFLKLSLKDKLGICASLK